MHLKKAWPILKGAFDGFGEDKVLRLSAALAYYAMFSIGPLLVIAVGLAGMAFGHDTVREQIQQQLQGFFGERSAQTIESMMAARKPGTSLITTIVGIIALLCGAAGVFGQLQDALNTIWGVKAKPGRGFPNFIRARFLSLAMVLGTGFLLLISMALTTFLAAVTGSLGSRLPVPAAILHVLNFVLAFGVITVLFAMIFKYLPDVKIAFRHVWVGAIGTALLFTLGKYLLAWYLGRESTTSPYGAAGAVIVILLWVYYGSVILFFGAEFTRCYAKQADARLALPSYAVPVTQEARAEQGLPSKSAQSAGARAAAEPRRSSDVQQNKSMARGLIPKEPWQFMGLMAAAGFAGGLLLAFKSVRKALQLYATVRRSATRSQAASSTHSR